MNGHDLASVIALDDIDAFEDDWLAVAAFASAGPLYGCRIAVDEDIVFGQAHGLKTAVTWVRNWRRASWPFSGGAPTGS